MVVEAKVLVACVKHFFDAFNDIGDQKMFAFGWLDLMDELLKIDHRNNHNRIDLLIR